MGGYKSQDKQEKWQKTNTNRLHMALGHIKNFNMRSTVKFMNYNLTNAIQKCEGCEIEKSG